jgi:hypothetical protein
LEEVFFGTAEAVPFQDGTEIAFSLAVEARTLHLEPTTARIDAVFIRCPVNLR